MRSSPILGKRMIFCLTRIGFDDAFYLRQYPLDLYFANIDQIGRMLESTLKRCLDHFGQFNKYYFFSSGNLLNAPRSLTFLHNCQFSTVQSHSTSLYSSIFIKYVIKVNGYFSTVGEFSLINTSIRGQQLFQLFHIHVYRIAGNSVFNWQEATTKKMAIQAYCTCILGNSSLKLPTNSSLFVVRIRG